MNLFFKKIPQMFYNKLVFISPLNFLKWEKIKTVYLLIYLG